MIPPPSLRLCGERGYFQAPSDRGLEVPPLFRTRTVLLSSALSLPKGGPPPNIVPHPPAAGQTAPPWRGEGQRMSRQGPSACPLPSTAIPRKPLEPPENGWVRNPAYGTEGSDDIKISLPKIHGWPRSSRPHLPAPTQTIVLQCQILSKRP